MTDHKDILDEITNAADVLNEALSRLPNGYMVVLDTSLGSATGVLKHNDHWNAHEPHVDVALFKHAQNSKPISTSFVSHSSSSSSMP